MSTPLAKQISARMKAKNISVGTLEREAGLKTHAVRNILRGKSIKPSAEILQAVGDVLGCEVRDLLMKQDLLHTDESVNSQEEILSTIYENHELLCEVIQILNEKVQKKNLRLSVKQFLTCIEEVYVHALQRESKTIDIDFADWFIDLMEN